MSSTCASCGEPLAPAAKFCAFCGTPRAEALSPGIPVSASASAGAPTTTMPAAPAPSAGTSEGQWGIGPRSAGATEAVRKPLDVLESSLDPATVLVFAAAALAFGLPSFVYSYAELHARGYGSAPKTVLSLLLVVSLVAASLGTWAAWKRLTNRSEEQAGTRMVFGVGVFAAVLCLLQLLAALGR
jgi:hypothetical protein